MLKQNAWQLLPKWGSTKPVCWEHCFTELNPGQPTALRILGLVPSTQNLRDPLQVSYRRQWKWERLQFASLQSTDLRLKFSGLYRIGHGNRMLKEGLVHSLLHGVIKEGTRLISCPCLRLKDALKRDRNDYGMERDCWKQICLDRNAWRARKGLQPRENLSQKDHRKDTLILYWWIELGREM